MYVPTHDKRLQLITQPVTFGLTKAGLLYANDRILVRNCTSFVVTPVHLVLTTTQHLLKFVHLTGFDGTCSRRKRTCD